MIQLQHTLFLFLSLTLSISAQDSSDLELITVQKWKDCIEKCGGGRHIKAVKDKGELVCISNWLGYKVATHTPCFVECMGGTPDGDQLKCMSEYCKLGWNNHLFCPQSKGGPLTLKHGCYIVAKGEAKLYYNCDLDSLEPEIRKRANSKYRQDWGINVTRTIFTDCQEKCGGKWHMEEASDPCFETEFGYGTPCTADCMGNPPDPYKTETLCFAKYCKGSPDQFCTEPGGVHIKKEECDTLVLGDKAMMYGDCVKGS